MAQLFRVTRLNDSTHCQTFTFILPPATTTDDVVDILSRDFTYGGHKWRLCLQKKDKHLSPYLQLISVSVGIRCLIDVNFVLINRESFTQNESYSSKQIQFDSDQPSHGHRTFITLDDLKKRHFSDSRNEFLFEVTLKQPRTTFLSVITLCNMSKPDHRTNKDPLDYQRYDTKPFTFGDLEWVCVFCPNMDILDNGTSRRHMVQITRKTRLDSLCKLNYRVVLGSGSSSSTSNSNDGGGKFLRTEMRQEIFDFNGNGDGIYFVDDYFRYSQGNQLKLNIELYAVSHINHLKLNVLSTDKQPSAQCFDTDRQSWCLKMASSIEHQQNEDFLSLLLTYPDYVNIPRDYIRYVSWNMRIIPTPNTVTAKEPLPMDLGGAIEQYYTNCSQDQSSLVLTKLKFQDLKASGNHWLDKMDHKMVVQIEWLSSYLLAHPSYHMYDDIYRKQIMQMRREIQALQSENYSLEKEMHSYQLSIADKCGSGSNTPGRTWSMSSTASNPSKLINGGPTSQLQAKAALAAVSLLNTQDRRSSVGLSTDQITIHTDRRRSSVEHHPSLLTTITDNLLSPPRSKSGGNLQEAALLTYSIEDVNGRLTPMMHRRTSSSIDKRMRSSKERSPKHSPPSVKRRTQDRGRRSQDLSAERSGNLPESIPVGLDHRREYSNSISVYDHPIPTSNGRSCLLVDPFMERGGERLRSRSVSDFTATQQALNRQHAGHNSHRENYVGHRDEYSRMHIQSQRPLDDQPRRRQPSPVPNIRKISPHHDNDYYTGYHAGSHYDR